MQIQYSQYRRGTVLVLVVVLLALLAIMGTSFVISMRIEGVAAENRQASFTERQVLHTSIDSIETKIVDTLELDLWGRPQGREGRANQNELNNLRLLGVPVRQDGTSEDPSTDPTSVYDSAVGMKYAPNNAKEDFKLCNEPWDAPTTGGTATYYWYDGADWQAAANVNVDGDPWLASSEATVAGTPDRFPQGSNLFTICVVDPTTGNVTWPGDFADVPYVDVTAATQDDLEKYADADGDGWLDSVWVVQQGFFPEWENTATNFVYADINDDGDKGTDGTVATGDGTHVGALTGDLPIMVGDDLAYRVAVRIVDTSGMLNVNTSWAKPVDLGGASLFMGETGAGVDLYMTDLGYGNDGVRFPGRDVTATTPTLQDLLDFQRNYVQRIESPDWGQLGDFLPLDLSDEIEFRSHWSVGTDVTTPAEEYLTGLTGTEEAARQYLTTHSFSRHIRHLWQTKPTGSDLWLDFGTPTAPATIGPLMYGSRTIDASFGLQQWLRYAAGETLNARQELARRAFALAVYEVFRRGGEADVDRPAGAMTEAEASFYAMQYIANLIDALDVDNDPTILTLADSQVIDPNSGVTLDLLPDWTGVGSQNFVAGVEKHPVLSELYVFRVRQTPGQTDFSDDKFDFEVLNPWTDGLGGKVGGSTSAGAFVPGDYFYRVTGLDAANVFSVWEGWTALTGTLNPGDRPVVNVAIGATAPEIPEKGQIELARRVVKDGTPYYVLADALAFNLGPAQVADEGDVADPNDDTAGYTWNLIRRYDVVDGVLSWLVHVDHQEVTPPDLQQKPVTDPIDETLSTVYTEKTLGAVNGVTLPGGLAKYGFWFADEGVTFDPNNLDEVRMRFPNPGFAGLPFYQGNVPYTGDFNLWTGGVVSNRQPQVNDVSLPLSYRMVDLNHASRPGERGIRLSFQGELGRYFCEMLSMLDRAANGADDNQNGGVDDLGELRLPGMINVNTASDAVLRALHPYITNPEVTAIVNSRPYKNISDCAGLLTRLGGDTADHAQSVQGVVDDQEEQEMIWSRIANLITTRSDTFVAYVLIEALDRDGQVQDRGRWVLLLDRSECCQPPLYWNNEGTPGDTSDDHWDDNPAYKRPSVVFRQRVE